MDLGCGGANQISVRIESFQKARLIEPWAEVQSLHGVTAGYFNLEIIRLF